MKSKILSALIAVALCSQAVFITSCSDDEDELTPEQREQQQAEKASTFWNIVGKLVSGDDVTDEYQGKTFEPTIGIADATNPTTRIVNTNDMRTAALRFADLVDATDINENTQTYEWSDPEIGTMTYTKGGDPANWATVDVDIKAVPTLQRIIYREGGEGDNGKFNGRAYYRFGDVVSRDIKITMDPEKNNDNRNWVTEYWICVRPAFGPEGKEDSHWVCVNTVTDKNYEYYHSKTNNKDYWLPYNLKTDKENMQNFAELLWAISQPDQWFYNAFNYHTDGSLWGFTGVPIFADFTYKHLKYHNEYFWTKVQAAWKKKQVAEKALNLKSFADISKMISDGDGIRLLYYGYSWWQSTSWNCKLWEAVYTNGTKDELNMHHAQYNEKIEHNMKDITFDVRSMGKDTKNYEGFFNNDTKTRWTIRHATGKELSTNKKFDVKQPISGVDEVYRYYAQYPGEWTRPTENDKPEVTPEEINPEQAKPGYIVGANGKLYKSYGDAYADESMPVAMVCYTSPIKTTHNPVYHYLAIALDPAGGKQSSKFKWGSHMSQCGAHRWNIDTDWNAMTTTYCGIEQTRLLNQEGQELHPAAWQAGKYVSETLLDAFEMGGTYLGYAPSQWFLPSVGEWVLFLKGLGVWDVRDGNQVLTALRKVYTDAGINTNTIAQMPNFEDGVWTSIESSNEQAYVLKIDANQGAHFEPVGKNVEKQVFPFIYY